MKKNKFIYFFILFIIIFLGFFWLNIEFFKFWLDWTSIKSVDFWDKMKYFFILIPAAIWDSINPCEFAIMFILLNSVMKSKKSKKSVALVWISFISAVFIIYLAIWFWLSQFLASQASVRTLKIVAWVLWILVWLASLKDYFWYWKWFKFEVPDSWRPKMKKLIKWITSPIWAFWIWVLVSFILLPCTSWPYLMVTTHIASQKIVDYWLYIYLIVYNIIFILPMILIMFFVLAWKKDVAELQEYKELNVEKMHLVTWIIMILLSIYIFYDLYLTSAI